MRCGVALFLCTATACAQQADTLTNYFAALYDPGNSGPYRERGHLEVFPLRGKPVAIQLPFGCGSYFYGPDGEALYCGAQEGVMKIELHPVSATLIKGSKFFRIDSLAVPARDDKIIISGVRYQAPGERGIFELNPMNGVSRVLVLNDKPASRDWVESAWLDLAVSPDGRKAAAMRQKVLEIIDLTDGGVRALSRDLDFPGWSPDGKWLAALDWNKGHTVLMDAATLTPRRVLRMSDAEWSPDSHYLLGVKPGFISYGGTFEATNIDTGKAIVIKSSRGKVNRATSGWVSSKIVPE